MKILMEEIVKKAHIYQADMTRFLRDMIKIPSESCHEEAVIKCIKSEMEKSVLIALKLIRWEMYWAGLVMGSI